MKESIPVVVEEMIPCWDLCTSIWEREKLATAREVSVMLSREYSTESNAGSPSVLHCTVEVIASPYHLSVGCSSQLSSSLSLV